MHPLDFQRKRQTYALSMSEVYDQTNWKIQYKGMSDLVYVSYQLLTVFDSSGWRSEGNGSCTD